VLEIELVARVAPLSASSASHWPSRRTSAHLADRLLQLSLRSDRQRRFGFGAVPASVPTTTNYANAKRLRMRIDKMQLYGRMAPSWS
jgi:hypothetical protein